MKTGKYTWEEALEILRDDEQHVDLIFDSYLTLNLIVNCKRFYDSEEFKEVLSIIKREMKNARSILDMPAGNGIASYAFAIEGFNVTAVDPDPSSSVGRGAIEFIKESEKLENIKVLDGYGEDLPFPANEFDVVYVRQGLHHAQNLKKMLEEIQRVLKPGGILIATREHVVDNYQESLKAFLDSQIDHQLYGGENAFLLNDYTNAIKSSGLKLITTFGPYDSIINLYPNSYESLKKEILNSHSGKILNKIMPTSLVYKIGLLRLRRKKIAGRIYSFLAKKEN